MVAPEILVNVWRGDRIESYHCGHAVVCDASGQIRAVWGNPDEIIYPRSSCKMLQALPLVESGLGPTLTKEQLALACASHQGAEMHVKRVADWLAELGLGENDLLCGHQAPWDRATRHQMLAEGALPGQFHNNCSGKHAGFVMLAQHLGKIENYVDPHHPVQVSVRAAFEDMTSEVSPGFGVDGCSAPNFATSVSGLAKSMARMAKPERLGLVRAQAAERIVEAMSAHPLLVAGEGRACSELMAAIGQPAVVKTGAEGVFTAILPEQGLGVALKIVDGATRASECAIAAILVRLGVLEEANPACQRRLRPPQRNNAGATVGHIAPAPDFWEGGRSL